MRYLNSLFSSNAKSVVVGNVVGQGTLLLAMPVITRLYSPSDFGIYQIGFFIGSFILPLSTLRVEQVIPKFKSESSVRRWVGIAYKTLFLTVFIVVIAGIILPTISLFDSIPNFKNIAIIAASFILGSSIMILDNAVLLYKQDYGRLATRNLLGGILGAISQILAGMISPNPVTLGVSLALGRLLAILLTMSNSSKNSTSKNTAADTYPLSQRIYAIFTGILSASALQLPATIFVAASGTNVGGQVATAQRVAGTPSSLIAQALSQVLAGAAGQYLRSSQSGLGKYVKQFTYKVAIFSVLSITGLVSVLYFADELIFGPGWDLLGLSSVILAPLFICQLIVSPLTVLLALFGDQKFLFIFEIIRTFVVTSSLLLAFILFNDHLAVLMIWSASGSLLYIVLFCIVLRRIKVKEDQIYNREKFIK